MTPSTAFNYLKKSGLIMVLIIIFLISGIFLVLQNTQQYPPKVTKIGEVIEFKGTLTDFDPGCSYDAQCVATVEGLDIITNPGMVGQVVIGQSDVWRDDIGAIVVVRAAKTDNNMYTIVGSKELFVLKYSLEAVCTTVNDCTWQNYCPCGCRSPINKSNYEEQVCTEEDRATICDQYCPPSKLRCLVNQCVAIEE